MHRSQPSMGGGPVQGGDGVGAAGHGATSSSPGAYNPRDHGAAEDANRRLPANASVQPAYAHPNGHAHANPHARRPDLSDGNRRAHSTYAQSGVADGYAYAYAHGEGEGEGHAPAASPPYHPAAPQRSHTDPTEGSLAHRDRTASHDRLRIITSHAHAGGGASSSGMHSTNASPVEAGRLTGLADPYALPLPASDTSHSHSRHAYTSSSTSHEHDDGLSPLAAPSARYGRASPAHGSAAGPPHNLGPRSAAAAYAPDYQAQRGNGVGVVPAPAPPSNPAGVLAPGMSSAASGVAGAICGACGKHVKGQFVRAMNKVFHLNCFRCRDCGNIVAAKFFPVEDGAGAYPLCERDYFARLGLICGKCDKALRGSYITACAKKYHVEHFTCSVCPVVFGPSDSYYEHDGEVYCHFHYSTRFAVKCVGCANAILKQFVEINRNQKDECWHPECYMIHKFWNVKLTSKLSTTPSASNNASTASSMYDAGKGDDEATETPESLRSKQTRMENQVDQIWKVLSAFEESSAGCISEMLRFVSSGQYLEAIVMAERFILHVEILFAAIDDLEAQFALEKVKGMAHAREAKMLCRKTVNFFSLLSHTQDAPDQRASITQELLSLVTGLAHYLKILIRIALTGSLKLEREHDNVRALDEFLARLSLLAMDDADPSIPRRGEAAVGTEQWIPDGYTPSTHGVAYGYRSLATEITGQSILKAQTSSPSLGLDGCQTCGKSIEDDCVRLGSFDRWHVYCLTCRRCKKAAGLPPVKEDKVIGEDGKVKPPVRRPPPAVNDFAYAIERRQDGSRGYAIFCNTHAPNEASGGFESVSKLEQYAFLLNVALRRLYEHLKAQGVVTELLPLVYHDRTSLQATYRDSTDIKRLKSVNLDRKLSATARVPQRSTIVESPSGRTADATSRPQGGQASDAVSVRVDSPLPRPGSREDTRTPSNERPVPAGPANSDAANSVAVIRPSFARNNTSVRIVSDTIPPARSRSADDAPVGAKIVFPNEEGVTLADIPLLVEAEQARLDQRAPTASPGHQRLLSELSVLDSLILKHFALLALQRSPLAHLIELDDALELMEVKKNGWWNKIFKGGKDKKDVKRKGVFGVPLEILVAKTGSDSQLGSSNAQLRVPEFVDNVISAMKQMDMSVVGIFRKNGNIKRLNSMAEALDRDATSVNLSEDNPVQLAALLKRFLRELPDPLLTYKLHRLWCAAQLLPNEAEQHRCFHLLVCLLPRYNRDTMEVLFVFLKWVASFSHVDEETGSRMDVQNLATVICPSILYSRGSNAMKDDSFVAIKAIQTLVENQDEFYGVPAELQFVLDENVSALFASSIDLPPKEIQKHCANYHAARHGLGQTPRITMPPARSDQALGSYRSDSNLSGAPPSVAHSRAATPTRPSSWVEVLPAQLHHPQGGPHPPSHHPMSATSSPIAPGRRNYPGSSADYGRRSIHSSPSASLEVDRRPSNDLDRVRSPLYLNE